MNSNTRNPGASGYKVGELKEWLDPVPIITLDANAIGADTTGIITSRVLISGLSGSLMCHVGCGMVIPGSNNQVVYPPSPGTMQLIPISHPPRQPRMHLRPVFQNPAGPAGTSNPLAENIPFGWDFSTEADEVMVEVVVDRGTWNLNYLGANGSIQVHFAIEFNGNWWDVDAIQRVISKVRMQQSGIEHIRIAGG